MCATLQVTNDVSQALIPVRPDQQAMEAAHRPLPPPPPIEYNTVIYTGDKMGAGTDATVSMEASALGCRARSEGREGAGEFCQAKLNFHRSQQPEPTPFNLLCAWLQVVGHWSRAIHTFDQGKQLFERNAADRFTVRIPDCGDLQTLRVWHDGGGMFSSW